MTGLRTIVILTLPPCFQASALCIVHPIPSRGRRRASSLGCRPDEAGSPPPPRSSSATSVTVRIRWPPRPQGNQAETARTPETSSTADSSAGTAVGISLLTAVLRNTHCRFCRCSGDIARPMLALEGAETSMVYRNVRRVAANAIPSLIRSIGRITAPRN